MTENRVRKIVQGFKSSRVQELKGLKPHNYLTPKLPNSFAATGSYLFTIYYLLFAICYLLPPYLFSAQIHPNAGTTSATFLKLPVGARAASLSGYIGGASGPSAIYWNPAGLADTRSSEFEFSHTGHFQEIKHDFVGYIHPLKKGAVGFGLISLYAGGIEGRSGVLDSDERYVNLYQVTMPEYRYSVSDIAPKVAYAGKMNSDISLGGNFKFIHQRIENNSGYTFAADFGAIYKLNEEIRLGAVLKNIGPGIKFVEKFYILPMELGAGLLYQNKKFGVSLDAVQPIDNYLITSLGFEYSPIVHLSLRGGYRYRLYGWRLGNYAGVSCGFGINFYGTKIDYALSSYGDLGLSHRFSVGVEFAQVGGLYKFLRETIGLRQRSDERKKNEEKPEVLRPLPLKLEEKGEQNLVSLSMPRVFYSYIADIKLSNVDTINKIFTYNVSVSTTPDGEPPLSMLKGRITTRKSLNDIKTTGFIVGVSTQAFRIEDEDVMKLIEFGEVFDQKIMSAEVYISPSTDSRDVNIYSFENDEPKKLSYEKVVLSIDEKPLYKIMLEKAEKIAITLKTK